MMNCARSLALLRRAWRQTLAHDRESHFKRPHF
jgi:hypothetical protein